MSVDNDFLNIIGVHTVDGGSPAAKSKFMVGSGIMVYSFFWYHLKGENVYFKNLPGAALVPLSIFFYLMIILPFGMKTP